MDAASVADNGRRSNRSSSNTAIAVNGFEDDVGCLSLWQSESLAAIVAPLLIIFPSMTEGLAPTELVGISGAISRVISPRPPGLTGAPRVVHSAHLAMRIAFLFRSCSYGITVLR